MSLIAIFAWISLTGAAHAESQEELEARMTRQVECLRVDPKNHDCRTIYEQAKVKYLEPRCERQNLQGTLTVSDGTTEATLGNIDRITLSKDDAGSEVMWVQFDMQGSDRLAKMTARGATDLKLQVNNQSLTTRPTAEIEDGRFQIRLGKKNSSTAREEFKRLCRHIDAPKLPKALEPR